MHRYKMIDEAYLKHGITKVKMQSERNKTAFIKEKKNEKDFQALCFTMDYWNKNRVTQTLKRCLSRISPVASRLNIALNLSRVFDPILILIKPSCPIMANVYTSCPCLYLMSHEQQRNEIVVKIRLAYKLHKCYVIHIQ